ncbi:MAG: GNAT family N-acetyltransferase, partial [Stackebrandtia sp.]
AEDRRLDLVAEIDGRVVGFCWATLDREVETPGSVRASVIVEAASRRRGVGRALLHRVLDHCVDIDAKTITGKFGSEEGAAFAGKHGFAPSRTERISHMSLDHIPPQPVAPEGIRLASLREVGDLHPLHELDSAVVADIPADEPWLPLPFEDWKRIHADDPRLDYDCTVLAFAGDQPVALAWIDRVDARAWSGLTGTHPDWRGRGLAKLVKTAALRRARERGATDAYTNNDETNAAMLAVNTWLGYRPHAEQRTCVRRLLFGDPSGLGGATYSGGHS